MEESLFSDRLVRYLEDDNAVESERGGYMSYVRRINLEEAHYLVPLSEFQHCLNRFAQEIQKAVKSHAPQ